MCRPKVVSSTEGTQLAKKVGVTCRFRYQFIVLLPLLLTET